MTLDEFYDKFGEQMVRFASYNSRFFKFRNEELSLEVYHVDIHFEIRANEEYPAKELHPTTAIHRGEIVNVVG